jgi:hypothetical protein
VGIGVKINETEWDEEYKGLKGTEERFCQVA